MFAAACLWSALCGGRRLLLCARGSCRVPTMVPRSASMRFAVSSALWDSSASLSRRSGWSRRAPSQISNECWCIARAGCCHRASVAQRYAGQGSHTGSLIDGIGAELFGGHCRLSVPVRPFRVASPSFRVRNDRSCFAHICSGVTTGGASVKCLRLWRNDNKSIEIVRVHTRVALT